MFLNISKIFYILFIFYIMLFQTVFFAMNNVPLLLGMGMIIFLLLHKLQRREELSVLITRPVYIWILFAFYAFLAGYFVATNKILLVSSIFTYIQTIMMMIFIINLSKMEESNRFFIKSYAILSLIYAFVIFFWGHEKDNGGIAISETANPSGDGMILLFGIFCVLLLLDLYDPRKIIVSYASIGFLFYAITLTGSRKAFISATLLIILWLSFVFKDYWRLSSLRNKVVISFFVAPTLGVLIIKFTSFFFDSAIYSRFTDGLGYEGDKNRIEMYHSAIEYFKSNPIFGIGFNQYRELWGTYSHSTYAEILSNTGILGVILYFTPYFLILYYLFSLYKNGKNGITKNEAILYIIILGLMCFLGTGVIHFYGIRDSLMFALMISFTSVEYGKLKDNNLLVKPKRNFT